MSHRNVSDHRRMDHDSGALVGEAFRRGSSEGVKAVRDRVRRIVGFRGYRMSADDKKDLEQEVMTQIWQAVNRSGFDAGDRFWGFVEVVTARRCIDWLRGRVTRNRETELDERFKDGSRSPLGTALDRERHEIAQTALARLGEPCRNLIQLHFARDKSYRELAVLLGKSEGALRVQMHRCIARTRDIVDALKTESLREAQTEKK
ncbi:MAG: sigma-70 family RNA polymerase sigma factor [bacterium]|nr:sigma-70 family RNA polymerase sigma factor [bacterium]